MATQTIQLEVPEEVARRFRAASEEDRQRLIRLLTIRLSDDPEAPKTLREATDALRDEARRNGMTADDLRDALGGDDLEGCL